MQKHCIKSSNNICFGGNFNKYPKHKFYEEIRIKQGLSYILFCPLRILYNSKFIMMATFLGTNGVVVTMVHCTLIALPQCIQRIARFTSLYELAVICKIEKKTGAVKTVHCND